jgi:hypothetical protein
VSLVPAGEQAEIEDPKVRRVAEDAGPLDRPLDQYDANRSGRRGNEPIAERLVDVPARAYLEKEYEAPQWLEPDPPAGPGWHDGQPKGKPKGEPKGGKGRGDVAWTKGGGRPGASNGYVDNWDAKWGGKMGSPLHERERTHGEGKNGNRNGFQPHGRTKGWTNGTATTNGWEPHYEKRNGHDGERLNGAHRGKTFYDNGQDLLPREYQERRARPNGKALMPEWTENSGRLLR